MRSHSKHLHFIPATLLLSLASPLLAVAPQREFAIAFGGTLGAIAQAQTTQIRKAEAERLIQEANSQFSQAESDEFSQEANSQLIERQYQKALDSFQQALSIYQELAVSEASPIAKRHEVQAVRRRQRDILFMIGVIYGKLGQYEQVLKYSQQVLALDQELGDRCQEQDTLFKISSMYGVLGQYDQVLEGLDKILAINRELDKPCQKSYLLFTVHDVYQMLGQPDQALKTLEQRLAFDRKVGDRKQEKLTLFVISRLYQQQRQYDQALAALQRALSINRELGERSSEQSSLIRIGEIYEQQGQYEQALQSYQQALTLNRKLSNPFGAINTFMSLSRVYQRLGQYEQALESYQQALAAGRSVGNDYFFKYIQEPYILMSLSQVYRQLGQDNQATKFYQQALAIGTKLGRGNREPLMRALNDWGSVQARSGQFQEALETFEKALAISREVSQNLGNICTSAQPNSQNLGIARVYPPKLAQAGSKCGSSMGQSGLEGAETLIFKNLGFVYRKLGQPEKSRESYEQALKRYQQKFARLRESNESCWLADELRIPREIAQLYKILGEDNLAREFYRQADKLEFVQYVRGVLCDELGEVGSGIVLTDDDDSSTPRHSR
jgi:tetratricopeptide (TPR) repeat protein